MDEDLGVIVGGEVGVAQAEVAREVADGVSGSLVGGQYGVLVVIVGVADGPINAHLTVGLAPLDGAVDVFDRPSVVGFHAYAIEPELDQRAVRAGDVHQLIELMEHNTRVGRANRALTGKWAPLVGGATGLIPMCGFSVMAAKLYEHRHVTLGTLLAVFISTSDEAFLVMLVSDMSWLNKLVSIVAMCGIKLVIGVGIGYLADALSKRRAAVQPLPEYDVHGHHHDHAEHHHGEAAPADGAYTACEHAHAEKWYMLYLVSPLLHALKVAAFVLAVNLLFGVLFGLIGEENVIGFLQGSGYWYQPLICSVLGLVPNCASSVILAEVYAMGGISFGSCLAGLIVNTGLGILVLLRNVKDWKRNALIIFGLFLLGMAVGYAVNGVELALPPLNI